MARLQRVLLWALALTETLADVPEALAGDDECLVGGCSTDLLQVNRSSGRRNTTKPPADFVPFPDESANASDVVPSEMDRSSINMSLANHSNLTLKSGWVGCWYYGCRRGYHREFYCQCNPTCSRYGNCCGDYGSKCGGGGGRRRRSRRRRTPPADDRRRRRNPPTPSGGGGGGGSSGAIVTVFHQTSPQACKAIVRSSFRPGSDGHCGGAIYFAFSPQATKTKAIGTRSQSGCVIQAKVDVGRVKYEGPRCGHKWNGGELASAGYDSIQFNPGDGKEVVIYDPKRVKSMKIIPYNNAWRPTYKVR